MSEMNRLLKYLQDLNGEVYSLEMDINTLEDVEARYPSGANLWVDRVKLENRLIEVEAEIAEVLKQVSQTSVTL